MYSCSCRMMINYWYIKYKIVEMNLKFVIVEVVRNEGMIMR